MSIFDPGLIAKREGDSCTDSSGRKGKVHFPPFFCPDIPGTACAAVMPQPICRVSSAKSIARQQRRDLLSRPKQERRSARLKQLKETKSADRQRLKAKAAQVIAERKARRKPLTTRTRRKR